MRAFIAFLKKELIEHIRNGKLLLLAVLFFGFGVMNPAIAKLTPWLLEAMSKELAESGMSLTVTAVDALTSWTQFFKNIPMALIAFICMFGGSFTGEYESGALLLFLTKGVARYKILLSKALTMLLFWTVGYWLCFAVTYWYNDYFWDNGIATGLLAAVAEWWVFGIFTVSLLVLFSVICQHYSGVLLGVGGSVLALYLLGLVPKLTKYLPTALLSGSARFAGGEAVADTHYALAVTLACCAVALALAVPIFQKKRL